jgi:hypothetical protein
VGRDAQEQIDQLPPKDRMLIFEKIKDLLNAENPTDPDEVTDIKELSERGIMAQTRRKLAYFI